ncbi:MAG: CBS domain-containing protein, partial [Acidobacteriota bacterium]
MYVRDALIDNPVTTTADETFESLLSRIVDAHDPTAAVLDADGRLVGLVGIHDVLRRVVPHYLDLDQKLMEVMHEGYVLERLMRLRDLAVGDFMATTI